MYNKEESPQLSINKKQKKRKTDNTYRDDTCKCVRKYTGTQKEKHPCMGPHLNVP